MQQRKSAPTDNTTVERTSLSARSRTIAVVFWILAFLAVPLWIHFDKPGWDIAIYHNAIVSLKAGHDPYSDAIAIQQAFHHYQLLHPTATPPYSYVYSPITLPLLRLLGALPVWLSCSIYWFGLIAGAFSVLWITTRAMEDNERAFVRIIAPVALFCPGLLAQDTILSGNIAFLLYGLVLLGAAYGWRRGRWFWCYVAIIVASCFKAPLLSLVAIPLLSARRQWLPAAAAFAIGGMLFAIQPLFWPSLFRHFMQAVDLQFSYNHDFGSSPAGILSDILVHHGISYSPAAIVFYLFYAAAIFALLLYLSRQFLRGKFSLRQWMPVLLVGVVLLNPRIMEYDAALLAIPMALIGWRFFTRSGPRFASSGSRFAKSGPRFTRSGPTFTSSGPTFTSSGPTFTSSGSTFTKSGPTPRAVIGYLSFFLAANLLAVHFAGAWKPTECFLLVSLFSIGCRDLLRQCRIPSISEPRAPISAPASAKAEDLIPANS